MSGSARALEVGTVGNVSFTDDLRLEVAHSVDFRVPGRGALERYLEDRVKGDMFANLSVSKGLIDRALGVGSTKVPLSRVRLDCLLGGHVLDDDQVAHLLAHERRTTAWKLFLTTQPARDGLVDQLATLGLGSSLARYLRYPKHRHRVRDALVFQTTNAARCDGDACADRWCSVCAGTALWRAVEPDKEIWEFRGYLQGMRAGACYPHQGSPSSEWLVESFGEDVLAWDLLFSLCANWAGTTGELVTTVRQLGAGTCD